MHRLCEARFRSHGIQPEVRSPAESQEVQFVREHILLPVIKSGDTSGLTLMLERIKPNVPLFNAVTLQARLAEETERNPLVTDAFYTDSRYMLGAFLRLGPEIVEADSSLPAIGPDTLALWAAMPNSYIKSNAAEKFVKYSLEGHEDTDIKDLREELLQDSLSLHKIFDSIRFMGKQNPGIRRLITEAVIKFPNYPHNMNIHTGAADADALLTNAGFLSVVGRMKGPQAALKPATTPLRCVTRTRQ